MSQRLLNDIGRAADCVALLATVGAEIRSVFVGRHGANIVLNAPGGLLDHLDARQVPAFCASHAYTAVLDGCLISWPVKP